MKKHQIKIVLFLIAFFGALKINAQHIAVNVVTITTNGTTDTTDKSPILINTDGKVVISSNDKVSASQYNATTAAQLNDGTTSWLSSFNASNQKSFMIANVNDGSGNVYAAGAIRTPTTNGTDFLVIKYDATGAPQWIYTYDGAGANGGNDAASSIVLDASGDVYVTGASVNTLSGLPDYLTIKLSSGGSQLWTSRYSYGGYMSIPTMVEINAATGDVIVSGSSANSYVDWDFATVGYDANTGAQINVLREGSSGAAQDKVFGMTTDPLGNIYVLGTANSTVNTSYDLKLSKLDTALNVVWSKTYDGYGFDDVGFSIDLDDSLNIYVAGYSAVNSNNNRELLILKYRNNGNFVWRSNTFKVNNIDAEGFKIKVKNHDEIFVGGHTINNGNQDVLMTRINSDGDVTLHKSYNGPADNKDKFMDFTLDTDNTIFVSARTYTSASLDQNIVIKYQYRDKVLQAATVPSTNINANASYVANDVIIGFNKAALKMSKINNKGFVFGKLSDFVDDSTCNKITALLDYDGVLKLDAKNLKTQKICPEMTTADSLSESRMGDYVKIPAFYAKLLVEFPANINTVYTAGILNSIKPDIFDSDLNYIYSLTSATFVPNDPFYSNSQSSLHATGTFTNAHISCDYAWDYTKGHSFVKVGVYDSGVSNTHPDLSAGVVSNVDFTGSSLGYSDFAGHGTQVAGVIGARSSNGIGVAGIAGGDAAATGTANTGVMLSNFKVFETGNASPLIPTYSSQLLNAYMQGASGANTGNGQKLNIMNNSYGSYYVIYDLNVAEGINYANKNGVAFVASRGNWFTNSTYTVGEYSAPSCMKAGKVMNVGASGNDGHYHLANVNGGAYSSMISHNLDFVAPGASTNIVTTQTDYNSSPTPPAIPSPTYVNFGGTSASAPHVSGVAALMMSYRNSPNAVWDNLVHEDIENILKLSATDLTVSTTYSESTGEDNFTGFGKINAGAALTGLEPQYNIRHIDFTHYGSFFSYPTTTVSSGVWSWPGSNVFNIPVGNYDVDLIKVENLHSYGNLYGNETFVGAWPLYKASNGFEPIALGSTVIPTEEQNYVELLSATNSTAHTQAYTYHLTKFYNGASTTTVDIWVPSAPQSLNLAFTLYTSSVVPTSLSEIQANVDYFNVYPNPNNGNFTLGFYSKKDTKATIKVMDITGRSVFELENKIINYGVNRFDLTLSNLPKGIYFINLDIETNKTMTKKIIIN